MKSTCLDVKSENIVDSTSPSNTTNSILSDRGQPFYHPAFDHVYLKLCSAGSNPDLKESYRFIDIESQAVYQGLCDDFGPMNLAALIRFNALLKSEIEKAQDENLALITDGTAPSLTNAAFLLGAYMITELGWHAERVSQAFAPVSSRLTTFRDISPGPQNFELTLADCWGALERAKSHGLITFGPDGFDWEEYEHFDSPINADLHVIVPNKIIAMKGPVSLPGDTTYEDTREFGRRFSPSYLAEILSDFEVKLVVRLNEPDTYDASEFEKAGIAVLDLYFDHCQNPPDDVVLKFLLIVEHLPGCAAVHCKAGLGRTGTLIALYLMKNLHFSAREAIGWMRIVRPGSVIGRQQEYLCRMERSIARLRNHSMSGPYAVAGLTQSSGAEKDRMPLSGVQAMMTDFIRRVDASMRR